MLWSMCVLFCSKKARRTVPQNYLWLGAFTLAESTLIAIVATEVSLENVILAIMATSIVTLCLFAAALRTANSANTGIIARNMFFGVLAAFAIQLVLAIFAIFTWSFRDRWWIVMSSCLVIFVTGIYIMFTMLMIIIPEITSKEDYILAALRLYVEIARLFYYVLIILGKKD